MDFSSGFTTQTSSGRREGEGVGAIGRGGRRREWER